MTTSITVQAFGGPLDGQTVEIKTRCRKLAQPIMRDDGLIWQAIYRVSSNGHAQFEGYENPFDPAEVTLRNIQWLFEDL